MHVEPHPDELIALAAARQHGLVTRAYLLDAGLTRHEVADRLASGHLRRRYRGIYAVGHSALTPLGEDLAAVLACGPGAVLASFTAAVLHDLLRRRDMPRYVTRTPPHRRAPHGVILHHVKDLPPTDITARHGIPVTTPARTLLDLAADAPTKDLERALDEAQVRRLIDLADLRQRATGRRGAKALRALLSSGPDFSRSDAERLLLSVIRRAGLPRPRTNVRVAGHEVDALWPEQRLVVEVGGFAYHGHRAAFEQDRARDADLLAAGVRVIRTTWRQLTTAPEAFAARLGAALADSV